MRRDQDTGYTEGNTVLAKPEMEKKSEGTGILLCDQCVLRSLGAVSTRKPTPQGRSKGILGPMSSDSNVNKALL